jgi:hypothetical protein
MTSKTVGLILLALSAFVMDGCRDCGRACTRSESCDECVARCVETQGVSPEICRGTACATPCAQR